MSQAGEAHCAGQPALHGAMESAWCAETEAQCLLGVFFIVGFSVCFWRVFETATVEVVTYSNSVFPS